MKVRTAILWLALLLGFCSCTDKQGLTDTLHRAEALMNEYPDSALQLLRALPVADMHQPGNCARYALLYSQALDKNYIDETNDSLINIAVDYYRTTDDVLSKFLAFYNQGRVYTNAGELHKAILAYTEAEQLADEVKDGYLVGLLYSEFGRIYRLYYDYPKSLEAYQKASQYYELAGKKVRVNRLIAEAFHADEFPKD
jgi:tetratricopeptide (TPR) repeat protein